MSNTKNQIKLVANLLVASIVLVGFSGSRCLASLEDWSTWGDNIFEGYLTIDEINIEGVTIGSGAGLIGNSEWDDSSVKIEYWVTAVYNGNPSPEYFHYKYIFSESTSGDLSHFNLEVSEPVVGGLPGFISGGSDYFNASQQPDEEGTISAGPGEPGMPHDIWALKYESGLSDASWTLEFDSMRIPVWGNFYAKDGGGNDPATSTYVYNSGFGHYPPNDYLSDYGYIARPDTEYVPVPPAVLLGLLGMTVAGVKLRKFA